LLIYTAQKIKQDLEVNHPFVLPHFEVNAKDRKYHFWERNSLGIDLYSDKVFNQKLGYIPYNPVSAGRVSSLKNITIHQQDFTNME
jgi:putative transposase